MVKSLAELSYPDAPKMVVKPPGPKSLEITEKINKVTAQRLVGAGRPGRGSVVWKSARGATVQDVDGNIYIDWTAGWHAASTGHSTPEVAQAIYETAKNVMINTGPFAVELRYTAAKKLLEIMPGDLKKGQTFFGSSGTEATYGAANVARVFTGKPDLIALSTHYHGHRGWQGPEGKLLIGPTPSCYNCQIGETYPECGFACVDFLENMNKISGGNNVAGVILEPWARYGGTPEGYLPRLKKMCEENNLLLLADDITCGFGRSGKYWWFEEWENVVPDILITAKGVGSGIPFCAVVAPTEMMEKFNVSQVHSFAMNPVTCAAVAANIDVMKKLDILNNVHVVGELIKKRFLEMQEEHEMIGDVPSKGLNVGVTIVKDRRTRELDRAKGARVFSKAFEKGLLNYGFTWATPPLCLTREQADKAMDIIEECIKEVEREG